MSLKQESNNNSFQNLKIYILLGRDPDLYLNPINEKSEITKKSDKKQTSSLAQTIYKQLGTIWKKYWWRVKQILKTTTDIEPNSIPESLLIYLSIEREHPNSSLTFLPLDDFVSLVDSIDPTSNSISNTISNSTSNSTELQNKQTIEMYIRNQMSEQLPSNTSRVLVLPSILQLNTYDDEYEKRIQQLLIVQTQLRTHKIMFHPIDIRIDELMETKHNYYTDINFYNSTNKSPLIMHPFITTQLQANIKIINNNVHLDSLTISKTDCEKIKKTFNNDRYVYLKPTRSTRKVGGLKIEIKNKSIYEIKQSINKQLSTNQFISTFNTHFSITPPPVASDTNYKFTYIIQKFDHEMNESEYRLYFVSSNSEQDLNQVPPTMELISMILTAPNKIDSTIYDIDDLTAWLPQETNEDEDELISEQNTALEIANHIPKLFELPTIKSYLKHNSLLRMDVHASNSTFRIVEVTISLDIVMFQPILTKTIVYKPWAASLFKHWIKYANQQ
jgi:hypothetical protein